MYSAIIRCRKIQTTLLISGGSRAPLPYPRGPNFSCGFSEKNCKIHVICLPPLPFMRNPGSASVNRYCIFIFEKSILNEPYFEKLCKVRSGGSRISQTGGEGQSLDFGAKPYYFARKLLENLKIGPSQGISSPPPPPPGPANVKPNIPEILRNTYCANPVADPGFLQGVPT